MKLKLLGYYSLFVVIFTLGAGLWPYETGQVTYEADWITQAMSIAIYVPVLVYIILSLKIPKV